MWKKLTRRTKFYGCIDQFDTRHFRGWIASPKVAGRLEFDVFNRGKYIGRFGNGFARPDIPAKITRDRFSGFKIKISEAFRIECLTDLVFVVCGTCMKPVLEGESYKLQVVTPWSNLQKMEALYAAYTDNIPQLLTKPCALFDKLAVHEDGDDYGTSAFGAFLRKKYPEAAKLDITRFFRWYLEDYYPLTDSMHPVILSKKDVTTLSLVEHQSSQGKYATVYSRKVARNIPELKSESENDSLVKLAYWWTCIEVPRLSLPSDMVPQLYIQVLSQVVKQSVRDEIKINEFIAHFAVSAGYDKSINSMRRNVHKIYSEIILRGLVNPVYIRLLPREGLARMLDASSGNSLLEQTLGMSNWPDTAVLEARLNQLLCPTVNETHGRSEVELQYFAPFDSVTGLGETARRMARAMAEVKLQLRYVNIDQRNGAAIRDHCIILSPPTTAAINIVQMNLDLVPEFVQKNRHLLRGGYLIVLPLWELDSPADCHYLGLTLADELWAVSRFIEDTFQKNCQKITYIGHPARQITLTPSQTQDWSCPKGIPFLFLTVFDALSWTSRKNPAAVVKAFKAAFSSTDNVKLLLKTQNIARLDGTRRAELQELAGEISLSDQIALTDETLSDEKQRALIASADCLVSLHRSEGLGIDLLDCVYSGLPVIATDYSGSRDFCTDETAWLVGATLEPVGAGHYAYATSKHYWAEPNTELASQAMRSVYEDNFTRITKANCGRVFAQAQFASQIIGAVIKKRLAELNI